MNASTRKPTRVQITERGKTRNGQEKNGEERQGETRGALEADLGRFQNLPSEGGEGGGEDNYCTSHDDVLCADFFPYVSTFLRPEYLFLCL